MAYILNETFTTGSRPASWWSSSLGDYAYATSPAPLEGIYSLNIEAGQSLYIHGSDVLSESWGHFMFAITTAPSPFATLFSVSSGNFNGMVGIVVNADLTWTLVGSGAFEQNPAAVLSLNTVYHCFWRVKPNLASNGAVEMWINTTNDRASTPAAFHRLASNPSFYAGDGPQSHSFPGIQNSMTWIVDVVQWADTDEWGAAPATKGIIFQPAPMRALLVR
jgi:hypothetical protein